MGGAEFARGVPHGQGRPLWPSLRQTRILSGRTPEVPEPRSGAPAPSARGKQEAPLMNPFRKLSLVRGFAAGAAMALVAASFPAPALAEAATGSAPKLVVVEDKKDLGTVAKGEP